jgi:hypothetical protein
MEQLICPIKVFCFPPFPSSRYGAYGIHKDFIDSYSSGPTASPRLTRGLRSSESHRRAKQRRTAHFLRKNLAVKDPPAKTILV